MKTVAVCTWVMAVIGTVIPILYRKHYATCITNTTKGHYYAGIIYALIWMWICYLLRVNGFEKLALNSFICSYLANILWVVRALVVRT